MHINYGHFVGIMIFQMVETNPSSFIDLHKFLIIEVFLFVTSRVVDDIVGEWLQCSVK